MKLLFPAKGRVFAMPFTWFINYKEWIMKLTCLLLALSMTGLQLLQAHTTSGQDLNNTFVTLGLKNDLLQEAFTRIEKQTPFRFAFNKQQVASYNDISLSKARYTLQKVLELLLGNTQLLFKQVNNNIVIYKKEETAAANPSASMLYLDLQVKADGSIRGKITNEKGEPVVGASVVLSGAEKGTAADALGMFSFNGVKAGKYTLKISAIGFMSIEREITVTDDSTTELNVELKEGNSQLTDIIVTGYTRQSKRDVTGAVSTVSADIVSKSPVTDIGSVLQGRVAGVTVNEQGGPGAVASVRIRGFGSNGNNDVLYVIDGVQMRGGSNLVNPNDIETITVLKDPSNTALYGAQGGNGVIVITTKTGKRGVPKLEYSAYCSFETPVKYPESLAPQQFADAYFGYLKNSNLTTADPSNIYGTGPTAVLPDYLIQRTATPTFLTAAEGSAAANASLYNLSGYRILKANKQGTDWFDEIFDRSFSHNHQLTLSGATDKSNYSLGLGYLDNQGTVLATHFKRYSVRVNTEFKPKDWLRIGENINFSYTQGNSVGGNNHNPAGILADLYKRSPLIPVFDIAGNYSGARGFPNNNPGFTAGDNNPVFSQVNGEKTYRNYNAGLIGSAFVAIEPVKGVVIESRVGAQFYPYSFRYFLDTFPQNAFAATYNSFTEGSGHSSDLRWTNKISYDKRFGDHKFSAFVAYESSKNISRNSQATVTDLLYTTPGYLNLSNGTVNPANAPAGGSSIATTTSFFGNLNYAFQDKYLLGFVARRDGSSKFGPLSRYGNFFSYSGGWRMSGENFMKNAAWINDLKLRAAYGENGNDAIPDHLYEDTYTTNPAYSGAFNYSSYDLGGTNNTALTGAGIYQLGNPYIHWETNRTVNLGFDATLFKNSLTVAFSWFNRVTDGLLAVVPITGLRGDALAPFVNSMKFSNKGWEAELGYNNMLGKLGYDMNFNISTYRNKVIYTDDFKTPLFGGGYGSTGLSLNKSIPGMPVSSFFGYIQEGIFQSAEEYTKNGVNHVGIGTDATKAPGHFKFRDMNGDSKIDDNDRTFIGNPHPDFSLGYNLNLNYKNFDMALFLQGVFGNKIFNYWRAYTVFPGKQGKGADDTWSTTNTDAALPIWNNVSTATQDAAPSTFFIEDGSYLRLKSLQIGYTVPANKLFNRVRIYLQGYNLATSTKYNGIDPEITTGNVGSYGIDFGGNYPVSRKFVFGVNVGL